MALPGGYALGETLYYTAASYTFSDGDRLVHGQQGEVVGPAPSELEGKLGVPRAASLAGTCRTWHPPRARRRRAESELLLVFGGGVV